MAVTFQNTDLIGAGTQFSYTSAFEGLFVLGGTTIASTGAVAIFSTQSDSLLQVDGAVYSGTGNAAYFTSAGADMSIGLNGIVSSGTASHLTAAIGFSGASTFSNAGQVTALQGLGVVAINSDNEISNSGSILAASGVWLGYGGGTGNSLTNSGLIAANNNDSVGNDPAVIQYSHGVHVLGNETTIVNLEGGVIRAEGIGKAGVHIGNDAAGTGDDSYILNYGTILSIRGHGVDFSDLLATETAALVNHGLVGGALSAFKGNDAENAVFNTGQMDGDVNMNAGADFLANSGLILGRVSMGDDGDFYQGNGDSSVFNGVYGGAGNDVLFGGQNDDQIYGEGDNDFMRGRQGDDELFGGNGSDFIRGNDGDDSIQGDKGTDQLFGGRGDDTILGGGGTDVINGGSGNDVLTGGGSADYFLFNRRSGDDEITDFSNDVDKLDLTAFAVGSTSDMTNAGALVANGAGSIIDLTQIGGDGVIYVEDMALADWNNADFIFA